MARRSIGRSIRTLRRRPGWRQDELAVAAGLSQATVSRMERDLVEGMTLGSLKSCVTALGGFLSLEVRWHGEIVDLLTDVDHAALQDQFARLLADWGWIVLVEVSFNHFGDRGRIDILSFHAVHRVLLVIEIKSRIEDAQDTVGRLDIKARIAPAVARDRGWSVRAVVPGLIVADDRTSQRRVSEHPGIFGGLSLRGRSALRWMRNPQSPAPSGLLAFIRRPSPASGVRDSRRVFRSRRERRAVPRESPRG